MDTHKGLRLKAEVLERYGLPDITYPVGAALPEAAVANDGELPFAVLLHGLQEYCADGHAEWRRLEPAMERLVQLIAPADDRPIVSAGSPDWWLEIGPIDPAQPVITIQREDKVLTALTRRADGRLRVAAFRPLDAKSARYLTGLGQIPHPAHGVCMRSDNWEYALDRSAGTGNLYAADRGEAYLSYWEAGIGVSSDGTRVSPWWEQRAINARTPACVAAELGVNYALSAP